MLFIIWAALCSNSKEPDKTEQLTVRAFAVSICLKALLSMAQSIDFPLDQNSIELSWH